MEQDTIAARSGGIRTRLNFTREPLQNLYFEHICDVQAKKEAADAEAEALEGGGEAEGFRFGRLLERKPEARPELLAFRDALLASAKPGAEAQGGRCADRTPYCT